MGNGWSQMCPPTAQFTESDIPDLSGRVVLVTGATSGVGYELAKMLFNAGATVWIGGRSAADGERVIEELSCSTSEQAAQSLGKLHFLMVDLSDQSSVETAANTFLSRESRLHVLFNNAAVSRPPVGKKSAQGHELCMATNCLGAYTLTCLLQPLLRETAERSLPNQVRVIWSTSFFAELVLPKDGMDMTLLEAPSEYQDMNYANSKLGNFYLAHAFAQDEARRSQRAVIHLAQNPGNLNTGILRNSPKLTQYLMRPLLYPAKQGAYTELWSGLSPDVTEEHNGSWVIPWGRFHYGFPEEFLATLQTTAEGEQGKAERFRSWCHSKVQEFV